MARAPISAATPLLRLRTDEQLVSLFRNGSEEAFRAIHDRYHDRLLAYTRQMLAGSRHDGEDALQEVFERAYQGLRAHDRALALRPWLYRVAHNRCIDQLRRLGPQIIDYPMLTLIGDGDPGEQAQSREELRRLVADIRRLPHHQRSALLMRELADMGHEEIGSALGVTVPAVKSLLVRARLGLVKAAEARDASCSIVQEEILLAHDRRVRPNALARRHLRECHACTAFRRAVRGTGRQVAALVPGVGLAGSLMRLAGLTGGGAAGSGAALGGGGIAAGGSGAVTGGSFVSAGILSAGAHVAGLVAAVAVTAGGAVAIQHSILPAVLAPAHRPVHHAQNSAPAVSASTDAADDVAAAETLLVGSGPLAPTRLHVSATTIIREGVAEVRTAGVTTRPTGRRAVNHGGPALAGSRLAGNAAGSAGTEEVAYAQPQGGAACAASPPSGSPPSGSASTAESSGSGSGTATASSGLSGSSAGTPAGTSPAGSSGSGTADPPGPASSSTCSTGPASSAGTPSGAATGSTTADSSSSATFSSFETPGSSASTGSSSASSPSGSGTSSTSPTGTASASSSGTSSSQGSTSSTSGTGTATSSSGSGTSSSGSGTSSSGSGTSSSTAIASTTSTGSGSASGSTT